MLEIFSPTALSARTADSRPGPGPLMRTSMFFTPHSCAARPARSAATCAAHGAFDREARDVFADALQLAVGEILDLARALHAGGGADRLRAGAADAKDRRQRDLGVLMVRDVDACYACHGRNLKLYQFEQDVINLGVACGEAPSKSPEPRPCGARSCTCGRFF